MLVWMTDITHFHTAASSEISTCFYMPASSVWMNLYQKWILCVRLQIKIPSV